jgi:hypothetical protein
MLILPMVRIYENYAEISTGAMIYILSFIKIGSAIQNLIGETHKQTDRHTDTQTTK